MLDYANNDKMATSSRPTSPTSAISPLRMNGALDGSAKRSFFRDNKPTEFFSSGKRSRRTSMLTRNCADKSKERERDPVSLAPRIAYTDAASTAEHITSHTSVSYDYDNRPSTSEGSNRRASIISDTLSKLGRSSRRRQTSMRQQPLRAPPMVIPGVIEISAPRLDEEIEERDRLREAAAQSIGISAELLQEEANLSNSLDMSSEAEDFDDSQYGDISAPFSSGNPAPLWDGLPRPAPAHRHSYSNPLPAPVSNIPAFPTSRKALTTCDSHIIVLSATFPKYHSSSRIFAISRHWKTRYILLTSPVPPEPMPSMSPTRSRHTHVPLPSYLHVFRSPAPEERELERLEVNEDSVVFVADEDIGGRKNVIKIAGKHAGGEGDNGKESEGPPKAETMWLLHAVNVEVKQTWIGGIKSVILAQRSVRAGLPQSAFGETNEPRGDMDVMLSMRVRSHLASGPIPEHPPQPRSPTLSDTFSSTPRPFSEPEASSVSSLHSMSQRSLRSNMQPAPPGTPKSASTVSALKGLFTRPRSPSVDSGVSQYTTNSGPTESRDEDSFGVMGNNLLSMSLARRSRLPEMAGSGTPSIGAQSLGLDRKISERQSAIWTGPGASSSAQVAARATRPMSAYAAPSGSNGFSVQLQPPPRKRLTTTGLPAPAPAPQPEHEATASEQGTSAPLLAGFSFGSPVQRPRQPSVGSVSTLATTMSEGASPMDGGSSPSTKRSSRRWSTQGSLPKRLTPPSGPPPAAPTFHDQASPSSRLQPHPYAAAVERSPSRASQGRASLESHVSRNYSKRASCSSAFSISSALSNGSYVHAGQASHRTSMSMPPPRPPPSFALPPPPGQETSSIHEAASASRTSFRDSVTQRSFRLSLGAPKPPPAATLPPRPDERPRAARRPSSSGGQPSLLPQQQPPPIGPLPPTPDTATPARSLKQRLRILSAPVMPATPLPSPPPEEDVKPTRRRPTTMSVVTTRPIPDLGATPPATPIAEKIVQNQNDPSFLQMYAPLSPVSPGLKFHSPSPVSEEDPVMISLSPPPRRGSKYLGVRAQERSESEKPKEDTVDEKEREEDCESKRTMFLSPHGSVISLGIVST